MGYASKCDKCFWLSKIHVQLIFLGYSSGRKGAWYICGIIDCRNLYLNYLFNLSKGGAILFLITRVNGNDDCSGSTQQVNWPIWNFTICRVERRRWRLGKDEERRKGLLFLCLFWWWGWGAQYLFIYWFLPTSNAWKAFPVSDIIYNLNISV